VKRLFIVALALGALYYAFEQAPGSRDSPVRPPQPAGTVSGKSAGQFHSGQQVSGSGTVSRILPDDDRGSRHQRFILRLPSGQTLLVAHNIDLAPRLPSLRVGDTVSFYGEYEWNDKGGVIHWTHRDPAGRHVAGWLEYDGKRYE